MDLRRDLTRRPVVELTRDELDELLAAAETLREHDTGVAGRIRVLGLGELVVVQEQTPQGQLLGRVMPSVEEAHRLVDDRLAAYDRMWNGCGCRIDYGQAAGEDGG